ncbi:uncharacterized protein LOC144434835 [Glandiceps talaboti]
MSMDKKLEKLPSTSGIVRNCSRTPPIYENSISTYRPLTSQTFIDWNYQFAYQQVCQQSENLEKKFNIISTTEKNMQLPNQRHVKRYAAIVILILFDFGEKFVSAAPIENCSANDRQYLHNGICCNMCQPGYKLYSHCRGRPDDRVCVPCPRLYYTRDWNYATDCIAVNPCNMSKYEYIRIPANSDGTSDNVCDCVAGYEYSPSGERCQKITEYVDVTLSPKSTIDETVTDITPIQTTKNGSVLNTAVPSETSTQQSTEPNNEKKVAQIIGFSLGTLLLICLCFVLVFFKRKKMFCFKNRSQPDPELPSGGDNATTDRGENRPMLPIEVPTKDVCVSGDEIDEGTGTVTPSSRRTSAEVQEDCPNTSRSTLNSSGYLEDYVPAPVGMKDKDIANLRKHMDDFVRDLPTQRVLDNMSDTFSLEDIAAITHSSLDECKQRRELVQTLIRQGPDAYDKFVAALDKVCKHLAAALKADKKKV